MPAVFIHGVPDTFRIWDPIRTHISRTDVITLALPGFSAALPAGFHAIKEEYVNWIVQQLERIGEPVDLVGHDWGCILTLRVASLRPDLIRSWAAGSGPVIASYEWHPLAQIWQTPGKGERWFSELDRKSLVGFMVQAGLPIEKATEAVSHIDSTMAYSILSLYRSAVHVGAEWQPGLKSIPLPGLIFWGEKDTACPAEFAKQLAADTGSTNALMLNADHWTIVERSAEVAQALQEHWKSVDNAQTN